MNKWQPNIPIDDIFHPMYKEVNKLLLRFHYNIKISEVEYETWADECQECLDELIKDADEEEIKALTRVLKKYNSKITIGVINEEVTKVVEWLRANIWPGDETLRELLGAIVVPVEMTGRRFREALGRV